MDETRGKRVAAALADFSSRPPARGPGGDPEWPVELFHRAAGSVPAYREFLREHGADPAAVRTLADFGRLPATHAARNCRRTRHREIMVEIK